MSMPFKISLVCSAILIVLLSAWYVEVVAVAILPFAIYLVPVSICMSLSLCLLGVPNWRRSAVICSFLLLVLAIIHFVPWASRKQFVYDLEKIEIGMELDTVFRIMSEYKTGSGYPPNPFTSKSDGEIIYDLDLGKHYSDSSEIVSDNEKISGIKTIIFRHSDAARFNGDFGLVDIKNGKVVNVDFSYD